MNEILKKKKKYKIVHVTYINLHFNLPLIMWPHNYTGWPKKRNGIFPVIEVYNDWYLLLRKMIPRSAILVKGFLF